MLPDEGAASVTEAETRTVELHHLDGNMHVNNCRYINFAMTAIGEEVTVKSLRADYRNQAHLKDRIYPVVYKAGSSYTVALNDEQGRPYSVVSVVAE